MNIIAGQKAVDSRPLFNSMKTGCAFWAYGKLWMAVKAERSTKDGQTGCLPLVNLRTGELKWYARDTKVEPVEADVVIRGE